MERHRLIEVRWNYVTSMRYKIAESDFNVVVQYTMQLALLVETVTAECKL